MEAIQAIQYAQSSTDSRGVYGMVDPDWLNPWNDNYRGWHGGPGGVVG
jgi:hypothetical protein